MFDTITVLFFTVGIGFNSLTFMIPLFIIITTICIMECIAWFTHKYLMHGPLWFIHKTHHSARKSWFEFNDIFGLFFGALAMACIMWGAHDFSRSFWIGIGISAYGILYFFTHDIIVHKRLKIATSLTNRYFIGLRKAHTIHHKTLTKENAEEFGFLFVKRKYLQK